MVWVCWIMVSGVQMYKSLIIRICTHTHTSSCLHQRPSSQESQGWASNRSWEMERSNCHRFRFKPRMVLSYETSRRAAFDHSIVFIRRPTFIGRIDFVWPKSPGWSKVHVGYCLCCHQFQKRRSCSCRSNFRYSGQTVTGDKTAWVWVSSLEVGCVLCQLRKLVHIDDMYCIPDSLHRIP